MGFAAYHHVNVRRCDEGSSTRRLTRSSVPHVQRCDDARVGRHEDLVLTSTLDMIEVGESDPADVFAVPVELARLRFDGSVSSHMERPVPLTLPDLQITPLTQR